MKINSLEGSSFFLSLWSLQNQRSLLLLEHVLKIDPITLHKMSKGSGTMPASSQADSKMSDMDHAEVHYFNRYRAFHGWSKSCWPLIATITMVLIGLVLRLEEHALTALFLHSGIHEEMLVREASKSHRLLWGILLMRCGISRKMRSGPSHTRMRSTRTNTSSKTKSSWT